MGPGPAEVSNYCDVNFKPALFCNSSMCVGEKRKLSIPSDLGYGDRGSPPKIPGKIYLIVSCRPLSILYFQGGATLIFEVELLNIERKDDL